METARPGARFHLRTVLWRADMQALVFHQNANNIICNIQGNIIVVLIGEKKNVDGCTCPPHHPAILITAAEIKRGRGGGWRVGWTYFAGMEMLVFG